MSPSIPTPYLMSAKYLSRFRSFGLTTAFLSTGILHGGESSVRHQKVIQECPPAPKTVTIRNRPLQSGWADLEAAVKALERLRTKVEEWGVVTISAPVAV